MSPRRTTRKLAAAVGERAGFTLVEVLVVLLIMSGLMLAMLQILNAARTSRDTIHNIQETQLAGPAVLDLIERDLRGLIAYDRSREELLRIKNRVVLGLDADSIDFVGTADSLAPAFIHQQDRYVRSDLSEIGYRCRPNPDDDNFLEIYRRETLGIDEEPFDGGTFTFLHDRVRRFDIQVFVEDGPDAEPQETWDTTGKEDEGAGLPLSIEIVLVLELRPRIMREQLEIAPVDKRTVTYRRIVRFPQTLIDALPTEVKPTIPVLTPPKEADAQAPDQAQQPQQPPAGG